MARVGFGGRDSNRDRGRGQLILLTGLALAVVMVGFVFLLNTAIATQHLATQGLADDGTDALAYQSSITTGAEDIIEAENTAGYDTQANVESNVSNGLDRLDTLSREHTLRRGTWTEATTVRLDSGARLVQTDSSRNLTSANADTTWTLARDTDGVRAFTINASGGLLSAVDPASNAYNVSVIGTGGNRWSFYIYTDATLGTVLAVKNGTEGSLTTDICSPSTAPTINLTAGTVDGTSCSALQFAKGVSAPYDVMYTNGHNAEGKYRLTVNTTNGVVESANFDASSSAPTEWPAVYAAVLDFEYESETLTYRERLRIARGEPDA